MLHNIKVVALICNNFCLKKIFVQHIFKAIFARKPNCAIRAEAKPLGQWKKICTKSCVLWFITTFVWTKSLYNAFLRHFSQKTKTKNIVHSGQRPNLGRFCSCNPSRDFYHIRSHTKFSWASSIIFLLVSTDTETTCQKGLFWTQ